MPVLSFSDVMDLGFKAHQAGRLKEAEYYYRELRPHQPANHRLLHLLGLVHLQTKRWEEARDWINQALELAPDQPEYYNSRGEVHREMGLLAAAREDYEKALSLRPDYADALTNLGSSIQMEDRFTEAEKLHHRAHELSPESPIILNNLGTVFDRTLRRAEAWKCYREAMEKNPRYLKPRINLVSSLLAAHQPSPACEEADKAAALFPQAPELWLWQARAYKEGDRTAEALAILEKHRQEFREFHIEALTLLASCYHGVGDVDTSLTIHQEVLSLDPDNYYSAYNHLTLLNYSHGDNAERMFQGHLRFAERFYPAPATTIKSLRRNRHRGEPLRLAYISNDFKNHSISRFILPIIERHDRNRFEVHCYALNDNDDQSTRRYQRAAHHWHKCSEKSDADLEGEIRRAGIDLLVDLGGLFGARLGLLARQPAPVQVCFLGYPNTCGLHSVQYRITDSIADPPGLTDSFHTEKLWRLTGSAWCYQPLGAEVSIGPLPADRYDHFTFGCFHGIHKYRPSMLAAWSQILSRIPNSVLILKSFKGLGHSETRAKFRESFEKANVDLNRIKFVPSSMSEEEHLNLFNQVDLALDTYPYNGTTITCEALWMGVPSVTLRGPTHVCRVGASLMTHAGVPEAVAGSSEDYIERAVNLANNLPRLRELRQTLRPTLQNTTLGNPDLYTRELEQCYQAIEKDSSPP